MPPNAEPSAVNTESTKDTTKRRGSKEQRKAHVYTVSENKVRESSAGRGRGCTLLLSRGTKHERCMAANTVHNTQEARRDAERSALGVRRWRRLLLRRNAPLREALGPRDALGLPLGVARRAQVLQAPRRAEARTGQIVRAHARTHAHTGGAGLTKYSSRMSNFLRFLSSPSACSFVSCTRHKQSRVSQPAALNPTVPT